jgi:hypothetical protein
MLCGGSSSTDTDVQVGAHPVASQCCFRCLFVWVAIAVVAIILIRR